MSEALGTTTGPSLAPPIDPGIYRFDTPGANSPPFRSVADDVAAEATQTEVPSPAIGNQHARDARDHSAADTLQPPPDQPPGGSGPAPGSLGTSLDWGSCVAGHIAVGAAKGAVIGAGSGAVIGAGYGAAEGAVGGILVAPGPGTLGGAAVGAAGGAAIGATEGATKGLFVGSATGLPEGTAQCGPAIQPSPPAHILESRTDPGLTQATGLLNGTPTGERSTSKEGDDADKKAGVDSENQVADKTAAAGYPTVQNPTEGPNPSLTRERLVAEGLGLNKRPDLLLFNRVYGTYTPQADAPTSIRSGIAEKINGRQTQRGCGRSPSDHTDRVVTPHHPPCSADLRPQGGHGCDKRGARKPFRP